MPAFLSRLALLLIISVVLGACSESLAQEDGAPSPIPESDVLGPISAGVRSVETFDQPFTLDFPNGWYRFLLTDNFFAIEPEADFDIVFMQPTELNDPNDLAFPGADFDPWDITDFDGWLAAIPQDLIAAGPDEAMIAGLPTTRVELQVTDEDMCANAEFCIGFARTSVDGHGRPMEPGRRYVIDWIELGDGQLPFVISQTLPETDEDDIIRDQFASLIDSLQFSET